MSTSGRRAPAGRRALLLALAGLTAGGCVSGGASPPVAAPRPLGEAPMCEASAAVVSPWDPDLVLVGDDDASDVLFAFRRDRHGWLVGMRALELPGGRHPADIEALAAVGDEVLVVGSHSRTGRCERAPARERVEVVAWDRQRGRLRPLRRFDGGAGWEGLTATPEACLARLFVVPPPPLARELCRALAEAERHRPAGACSPLDLEGAAGVDGPGGPRVWLGLRRPRLDGRPVLVRLVPGLGETRFDAVALVDAGDRGVRALAAHGGRLWAVLGPEAPGFDRSALWRAEASGLAAGALVAGEVVRDGLPPSSEGLVVSDRLATVIVDGDAGRAPSGSCRQPSWQVLVELPEP